MTVAPAVLSAIESALSPFDVKADRYPITPAMLVEQIRASEAAKDIL